MSGELGDSDLTDLEERLREAQSFTPRPGLQAEIRSQLRPAPRQVPWAAFSAAAAVLIAVLGVGYLLSHAAVRPSQGASSSASSSFDLAFGRLPAPPAMRAEQGAAGAAAQAAGKPTPMAGGTSDQATALVPQAATPPGTALVFRWPVAAGSPSSPCPPPPVPIPHPVLGSLAPCGQPLAGASYRLAAAPAGSQLVYVSLSDSTYGYFEPAYVLPDGRVISALTPDELRG